MVYWWKISLAKRCFNLGRLSRPTYASVDPCRSGEHHTIASLHSTRPRSSWTLPFVSSASSGNGRPLGSKVFVSAPKADRTLDAASVINRLKDRSRKEPYNRSTFGRWLKPSCVSNWLSSICSKPRVSIWNASDMYWVIRPFVRPRWCEQAETLCFLRVSMRGVAHPRGDFATALTCILYRFCQFSLATASPMYDQLYDRSRVGDVAR